MSNKVSRWCFAWIKVIASLVGYSYLSFFFAEADFRTKSDPSIKQSDQVQCYAMH